MTAHLHSRLQNQGWLTQQPALLHRIALSAVDQAVGMMQNLRGFKSNDISAGMPGASEGTLLS
jgi:hypothetical protein